MGNKPGKIDTTALDRQYILSLQAAEQAEIDREATQQTRVAIEQAYREISNGYEEMVIERVKFRSLMDAGPDSLPSASVPYYPPLAEGVGDAPNGFRIGDLVTISMDPDLAKDLQEGYGGWNDDMIEDFNCIGIVYSTDTDGFIEVFFGLHTWMLNPAVCVKMTEVMLNALFEADRVRVPGNEGGNDDAATGFQPGTGEPADTERFVCPIDFSEQITVAFGCGHCVCESCSNRLTICPFDQSPILSRMRIYL